MGTKLLIVQCVWEEEETIKQDGKNWCECSWFRQGPRLTWKASGLGNQTKLVSNGTLEDSEDKEDDDRTDKIFMIGKIYQIVKIVKIGEIDNMISKIR